MNRRSTSRALDAAQHQTLTRIQQLLQSGAVEAALKLATQLSMQASDSPDAQQALAMCRAAGGDMAAADIAFRKALKLAPDHPLILTNYAHMMRRSNQPEQAVRLYQQATRRAHDLAPAWLGLGTAARAAGNLELASHALERYVSLASKDATGWHELGRVRQAREEFESAREAYITARDLAPDQPAYPFNVGICERLLGRPDQALEWYQKARQLGLRAPELLQAEVGAMLDCGQMDEALARSERLNQEHPGYVPGYETRADLLWEYGGEGDQDPADLFTEALARQSESRSLQLAFASFLLKAKRGEQAVEVLKRLREQEDHPSLVMLMANGLEISNQTEAAGRLYRKIHGQIGDNDPAFLCAFARHLLRAGEWKQAEKRARAATRLAPENQEAWAYLGTAWRLLGDAREVWLFDYDRTITFLDVPVPEGYDDRDHYLAALCDVLNTLHKARREPIQQSLRNGSQTPGRLFGRHQPVIQATQQALTSAIEEWLTQLPENRDHPFFQRNTGRIRYTGSWSVKLWSSGNHVNHIHPQGWISSAYYVALPPSVAAANPDVEETPGCIQFGQPPVELGLDLSPRRVIHPKPGHLALFPSYMWHGTVPFDDTEPRITIAFDMRAAV